MQVNIERMPHGLFRRLSSDVHLLTAFGIAFCLSVGMTVSSVLVQASTVGVTVAYAFWATVLSLLLFYYAYQRALSLVSPVSQLDLLVRDASRSLTIWAKRATRAKPLIPVNREAQNGDLSDFEAEKAVYFTTNRHWTADAIRAVSNAVVFARKYAEQGDYEVSASALRAIISIHLGYVEARQGTFVRAHPLVDDSLSRDAFLIDTLERIRQMVIAGLTRGDEQQVEQLFHANAALVEVYLRARYSSKRAEKHHANLAAGYLSGNVKRVLPHKMADVLMEGVKLLGDTSLTLLRSGSALGARQLTSEIAALSVIFIVGSDFYPVTRTCMGQFREIVLFLLRAQDGDFHFMLKDTTAEAASTANQFLSVPISRTNQTHSFYLAPFYSGTDPQGLIGRLAEMANALIAAEADNETAQKVIRNIEDWGEELADNHKKLLIEAAGKQSNFAFDLASWIVTVAEILFAVSSAPACDEHSTKKLRRQALWLIYAFTWIEDAPAVKFLEIARPTEKLFEAATAARKFGCHDESWEIAWVLLEWGFRASIHPGWKSLEETVVGLASLALGAADKNKFDEVKNRIAARLKKEGTPDQETLDKEARAIRTRAMTDQRREYLLSPIDRAAAQLDRAALQAALLEISDLLSPETADEDIEIDSPIMGIRRSRISRKRADDANT
jgi:IS5 family transposase